MCTPPPPYFLGGLKQVFLRNFPQKNDEKRVFSKTTPTKRGIIMKDVVRFLGIVFLVAAIATTMACDDGNGGSGSEPVDPLDRTHDGIQFSSVGEGYDQSDMNDINDALDALATQSVAGTNFS